MTTEEENKLDLTGAIIGIPLEEYIAIENAILDAKKEAEKAVLAANPEKKQAAIEKTLKILEGAIYG